MKWKTKAGNALGEGHARSASAASGQGGQDRAEAIAQGRMKTGRNQRRNLIAATRRLFFMPLFAMPGWTNTDHPR